MAGEVELEHILRANFGKSHVFKARNFVLNLRVIFMHSIIIIYRPLAKLEFESFPDPLDTECRCLANTDKGQMEHKLKDGGKPEPTSIFNQVPLYRRWQGYNIRLRWERIPKNH